MKEREKQEKRDFIWSAYFEIKYFEINESCFGLVNNILSGALLFECGTINGSMKQIGCCYLSLNIELSFQSFT